MTARDRCLPMAWYIVGTSRAIARVGAGCAISEAGYERQPSEKAGGLHGQGLRAFAVSLHVVTRRGARVGRVAGRSAFGFLVYGRSWTYGRFVRTTFVGEFFSCACRWRSRSRKEQP